MRKLRLKFDEKGNLDIAGKLVPFILLIVVLLLRERCSSQLRGNVVVKQNRVECGIICIIANEELQAYLIKNKQATHLME